MPLRAPGRDGNVSPLPQTGKRAVRVLGDQHSAALVQVSLLTALAMLGRYADAIVCGEAAVGCPREQFGAHAGGR